MFTCDMASEIIYASFEWLIASWGASSYSTTRSCESQLQVSLPAPIIHELVCIRLLGIISEITQLILRSGVHSFSSCADGGYLNRDRDDANTLVKMY